MKRLLLIVAAVLLLAPARPVEAARKKVEDSSIGKLMDSYKNVDGAFDLTLKRFWLGLGEMVSRVGDEPLLAEMLEIMESVRIFVLSTEEGDEILSVKAGHEPKTPTETETGSSDDPENYASADIVGRFLSAADVILSEHYQLMTSESTEFGTIENVYYSDAFAELLFYKTDADGSRLANMILVKFDEKELELPESEVRMEYDRPMSEVLTACKDVSGVDDFMLKGLPLSIMKRVIKGAEGLAPESEMKEIVAFSDSAEELRLFRAATARGKDLLRAEADSLVAVTDTTTVGSTNPDSSENRSSCVSDEDMERLLSEIETVLEGHYRRTAAVVNGYGIVSEPYGSTFSFDEASSEYYLFVDKSLTPASIVEIIVVQLLKEQDKVEAVEVCQAYVDVDGYEMIDEDLLEKILDIITGVI